MGGLTVGAPIRGLAAEVRPFDPEHPVYQPIPPACPVASYSAAAMANMMANWRQFFLDTDGDSPPVYIGAPSDPTWTLIDGGGNGFTNRSVKAPEGIVAGTGIDAPLVILDRTGAATGGFPVEYRMFDVVVNTGAHTVTYQFYGMGTYHNDGRRYLGDRALAQAEIDGANAGSNISYTCGMLRPLDFTSGRIAHAIRVACSYINATWVWPATKSDQSTVAGEVPMGSRVFLPETFSLTPLYASVDANSTEVPLALAKTAAKLYLRALQEFGLELSDGGGGTGHNSYCEGDQTAGWVTYWGARNAFGSWNHIGRAVRDALAANSDAGYLALRVADPSAFNSYGAS